MFGKDPSHSILSIAIAAAALLPAAACNPLAFENVVEDAHVRQFVLKGTLNAPVHSNIAVPYDTTEDGLDDHLLIANGEDASLGWMELNEAGFARGDFPEGDVLNALFFPIERADQAVVGGLARVPDPMAAMTPNQSPEPYGIVSFQSPTDLERARVVRFRLPGFQRVDDVNVDIINVKIDGALLPRFGRLLAAINLDADQDDPDYEVAIATELGIVVIDNLGKNRLVYEQAQQAAEAANPGSTTGDNEAEGYGWTYCGNLTQTTGLVAGAVGPSGSPTFVVSTPAGLTLVGQPDTPIANTVGAPVFDCAKREIAAPPEGTSQFGAYMFVDDVNGDGLDDLCVGDPEANRVFVYLQLPDTGLAPTPAQTLMPFDDEDGETVAFGAAIGRAELGEQIGPVLLVGAPDSGVGQTQRSGRFFVFSLPTFEPIRAVVDTEPTKNTFWGTWVGGVSIGDREEIVNHGDIEGRVHVALNEDDPRP